MLADYLPGWLAPLASTGLDVYVYDFRGYGRSGGKSLFSDITLDYDEIIKTLDSTVPGRHMLYGISFGGIVLLRSIADGAAYDAAVIDSVPSKLPVALNCDSSANPVNNLPKDSSHILLISGGKDKQVTPHDMEKLIQRGRQNGAQIILDASLQHPALAPKEDHQVRFPAIETFWSKFL